MAQKNRLLVRVALALVRFKFGLAFLALDALRAGGKYIYDNGLRIPGDGNTYHDECGRRRCAPCGKVVFNSQREAEVVVEEARRRGDKLWWRYEHLCKYYHLTEEEQRSKATTIKSFRRWIP